MSSQVSATLDHRCQWHLCGRRDLKVHAYDGVPPPVLSSRPVGPFLCVRETRPKADPLLGLELIPRTTHQYGVGPRPLSPSTPAPARVGAGVTLAKVLDTCTFTHTEGGSRSQVYVEFCLQNRFRQTNLPDLNTKNFVKPNLARAVGLLLVSGSASHVHPGTRVGFPWESPLVSGRLHLSHFGSNLGAVVSYPESRLLAHSFPRPKL